MSLVRIVTAVHVALYRASGGRLFGKMGQNQVLVLTTTGRKSGQSRSTPLFYVNDGASYIVVASAGGASAPPAWWLNLQANPSGSIEAAGHRQSVTASQVAEEDKPRLWQELARRYPGYDAYQRKTTRVIPLVRLQP